MSSESLTSPLHHFSHNVIRFFATFLYWKVCLILSLLLYAEQKATEISLPLPSDTFKTKACSKLALQSTDYCVAFTQSR